MPLASQCASCESKKVKASCPLCEQTFCNSCLEWMTEEAFFLETARHERLSHSHYCCDCYQGEVADALALYEENAAKAREAFVFFTSQKKGIPLIRKANQSIQIKDNPDRDETILRLAYQAVLQGHNAIIDCEVKSEKQRHGGWQKMRWSGTAVPATVDENKLNY
jgi:hypothetical protein